jgi:hypothetical protein
LKTNTEYPSLKTNTEYRSLKTNTEYSSLAIAILTKSATLQAR